MKRIITLLVASLLVAWWIPNHSANATAGTTWTAQTAPAADAWSSVAFGENTFVAVSWSGTAMYSTNGTDWQLANVPSSNSHWVVQ